MRDRRGTAEKHGPKDAGYAPRFDRTGAAVRELQTPNERGEPVSATSAPDHWSGSKHVVQVRPHVWNWLAPRIGGGAVLEIGPGLRPTAPVATSTFIDASAHALAEPGRTRGNDGGRRGGAPLPRRSFDAVLAFEVIEHVDDDTGLLGEMARVSRPGGMLILSTPVHASDVVAAGRRLRSRPSRRTADPVREAAGGRLRDRWLFVDARAFSTPHRHPGARPPNEPPALDRVRPNARVPDPRRLPAGVLQGEVAGSGRAGARGSG